MANLTRVTHTVAKKTANNNVKRLLNKRAVAYQRKLQWQTLLQQTYKLSQPNRNILEISPIGGGIGNSYLAQGTNLNWDVYDLTLAHATEVYVNRMVNAMIPPGKRWLNFVPGADIPEEFQEEAKKVTQELTDRFFYYLNQSNFDLVAPECFMDMAVSTGYMIINEGIDEDEPLIFSAMPPYITYACEGPHGKFDAYFRDFVDVSLDHAREMWPDFRMPSEIVEKEVAETTITLYEMTYFNYEDRQWHYLIVYPPSEKVCYEKVDDSSPCVGFRAKKLSGEVDGRGPAMDAMPAAATINQVMYDEIQAANLRAQPIYMGFDDGVFNPHTFKMVPNTVIACSPSASGAWPIQPLPPAGDINWSGIVLDDLRGQINEIMLTQPFGPIDSPAVTATEIIQRQQQILENASAAFSRIQREFFEPVVKRVTDILRRRGLWEDVEIDGKMLAVTFETPLTQSESQKEVMTLLNHHQSLSQIVGPEMAMGYYQLDEIGPWIADKLDVPLQLVKSQQDLLEQFQMMQEAQQAQQQSEEVGAEAAEAEEQAMMQREQAQEL